MRPAFAFTAAVAALAVSTPAALATTPTTTVSAQPTVAQWREVALEAKQLLDDATLDTPERASLEVDYRLALAQWRKALIAEGDEIVAQREAAEAEGTLTEEEAEAFAEALDEIAEERALVRELRAELQDDDAVVLPTVLGEIEVVREVAVDAVERSEDDKQVAFGELAAPAAPETPQAPVTTAATAPTTLQSAPAEPTPSLSQRVITLQDSETTTSTSSSTASTTTSSSTSSSATTTEATTTEATTSMTAEVLQNRTTEATTTASSTKSSTTSSTSTTSSSKPTTTTTTADRDDDLAETGTPMLGVLAIAALLIAGGVYLTRRA